MIKRNMVKAGDILQWKSDEDRYLMLEETYRHKKCNIWRALNMVNGRTTIIEMSFVNADCWRKVA